MGLRFRRVGLCFRPAGLRFRTVSLRSSFLGLRFLHIPRLHQNKLVSRTFLVVSNEDNRKIKTFCALYHRIASTDHFIPASESSACFGRTTSDAGMDVQRSKDISSNATWIYWVFLTLSRGFSRIPK